ncbi:MAG: putative oxidoreductase [Ilumatobacteraceae bacterium]|nr:putative oxidoreductase [Ilumatobacteraceae bacterium]
MSGLVRAGAKQVRGAYRQRQLEAGESGWGAPVAPPPVVPAKHRPARVVVIGAGIQGGILAQGTVALEGAELVGIADLDTDRARALAAKVGLAPAGVSADAAALIARERPELVCVATTAPSHVALGRVALDTGVRRILLEKPIDISYDDAVAFDAAARAAGAVVGVNYFRRWAVDPAAVRDAVRSGAIGRVQIVTAQLGASDLAMIGSHFIDLCRFFLDEEIASVSANLHESGRVNVRGADFEDPTGHVLLTFAGGARAFIDFDDGIPKNDFVITLRGEDGIIVIEEGQLRWSLRARSTRTWTFPMATGNAPVLCNARVLHGMLTGDVAACTTADGLAALDAVLAAHHSSADGGRRVALPLTHEQRQLVVRFP